MSNKTFKILGVVVAVGFIAAVTTAIYLSGAMKKYDPINIDDVLSKNSDNEYAEISIRME